MKVTVTLAGALVVPQGYTHASKIYDDVKKLTEPTADAELPVLELALADKKRVAFNLAHVLCWEVDELATVRVERPGLVVPG